VSEQGVELLPKLRAAVGPATNSRHLWNIQPPAGGSKSSTKNGWDKPRPTTISSTIGHSHIVDERDTNSIAIGPQRRDNSTARGVGDQIAKISTMSRAGFE